MENPRKERQRKYDQQYEQERINELNGLEKTMRDPSLSVDGKLEAVNQYGISQNFSMLGLFPGSGMIPSVNADISTVQVPTLQELRQREIDRQNFQRAIQAIGAVCQAAARSYRHPSPNPQHTSRGQHDGGKVYKVVHTKSGPLYVRVK